MAKQHPQVPVARQAGRPWERRRPACPRLHFLRWRFQPRARHEQHCRHRPQQQPQPTVQIHPQQPGRNDPSTQPGQAQQPTAAPPTPADHRARRPQRLGRVCRPDKEHRGKAKARPRQPLLLNRPDAEPILGRDRQRASPETLQQAHGHSRINCSAGWSSPRSTRRPMTLASGSRSRIGAASSAATMSTIPIPILKTR